jgi:hypothetical protein
LQKWEAASASDWSVAVEREAVIQPLAEQKQLSIGDVDDAMSRLGMSRSFLYKLIRRFNSALRVRKQRRWPYTPFQGSTVCPRFKCLDTIFVLDLSAANRSPNPESSIKVQRDIDVFHILVWHWGVVLISSGAGALLGAGAEYVDRRSRKAS